jgi:opacity protein-like surface antigen
MRFMKLGTLAAATVLSSATAVYAGDAQQNWNGFYVGGSFGAGWSPTESKEGGSLALQSQFPSRPALEPGGPWSPNDGLRLYSGFQAGLDWQIPNSPFVLGSEGDQSR